MLQVLKNIFCLHHETSKISRNWISDSKAGMVAWKIHMKVSLQILGSTICEKSCIKPFVAPEGAMQKSDKSVVTED